MSKFIITQEQFDAAFAAGAADAAHLKGEVNAALYDILLPLSGKVSDADVAVWEALRVAFVDGQATEHVEPASAGKRWTRLVDSFDLVKPQSVAAAAKAAQRARAKTKGATPSKATVSTGAEVVVAVASTDKAVAENARLSACIELLKHLDAEHLIKAQAALLKLAEEKVADATM